jgi:oxygen-independent coproporphyrinogen-3 oxidase
MKALYANRQTINADKQCSHNLNYWSFGDYLGIGAGAHGKITQNTPHNIVRTTKPKQPEQYLKQDKSKRFAHAINSNDLALEFVMNNLRLKGGFSLDIYTQRTGLSAQTLEPAAMIINMMHVDNLEYYAYSKCVLKYSISI